MQAYDFYILHKKGVKVQIGGSDQWGNITAGIELIRRKSAESGTDDRQQLSDSLSSRSDAFGVSISLLTNANGEKFGKSAGNAVWLCPTLLSTFEFYQFFKRVQDDQVEKLLKIFTFLELDQVNELMTRHNKDPERHEAQKVLAREVTSLVHGEQAALVAETKSAVLYEDALLNTDTIGQVILEAFSEDNTKVITLSRDQILNKPILDVFVNAKLTATKSQARKLFQSGALYLNKHKISQMDKKVEERDVLGVYPHPQVMLLRTGKTNYKIVHLVWLAK